MSLNLFSNFFWRWCSHINLCSLTYVLPRHNFKTKTCSPVLRFQNDISIWSNHNQSWRKLEQSRKEKTFNTVGIRLLAPWLLEPFSYRTFSSPLSEMVHLVMWLLGYCTFCLLFRSPFGYRTKNTVTEWSYGP